MLRGGLSVSFGHAVSRFESFLKQASTVAPEHINKCQRTCNRSGSFQCFLCTAPLPVMNITINTPRVYDNDPKRYKRWMTRNLSSGLYLDLFLTSALSFSPHCPN